MSDAAPRTDGARDQDGTNQPQNHNQNQQPPPPGYEPQRPPPPSYTRQQQPAPPPHYPYRRPYYAPGPAAGGIYGDSRLEGSRWFDGGRKCALLHSVVRQFTLIIPLILIIYTAYVYAHVDLGAAGGGVLRPLLLVVPLVSFCLGPLGSSPCCVGFVTSLCWGGGWGGGKRKEVRKEGKEKGEEREKGKEKRGNKS